MQRGLKKTILMTVPNELKRRDCVYSGKHQFRGLYLLPDAPLSDPKASLLIWD